MSILAIILLTVPAAGQEPSEVASGDGFDNILSLMEQYDGKANVSLMKVGRLAMTMGKTVGKAGTAWTRKVAKAFRKVNTVYMLEYGESRPELRDEIEASVLQNITQENLLLRNEQGGLVFDETFGERSEDGKHVSDVVLIMYGQSVVALKGTILSTDVERIVRRLNKQL